MESRLNKSFKFPQRSLEEVCQKITDGSHSSPPQTNDGIPMYSVKDMTEYGFSDSSVKKISETDYLALLKNGCQPEVGDVLIAKDGSVLKHVITFDSETKCALLSSIAILRPNPEIINSKFLAYSLKNPQVQENVLSNYVSGSGVPRIVLKDFKKISIMVPDLITQRGVVSVLGSIDQKIRVNQQIASTLEQIAQTIFKSWFVDFDPVHAKARGEQPVGMDAETAALFPDSFEESDLGPIPKGWKLGVLGDLVQVIDCLHSKKPVLLPSGRPYLQLDTITGSGVLATEKAACISEDDYNKWISRIEVTSGDCVITNVGRVGAVSQIPENFKAAIGRNITALRPLNAAVARTFLIELLLSRWMRKEIQFHTDSGTILDALNVKNIPSLRATLPAEACMKLFENTIGPLRHQMNSLHAQNVVLAQVRDSLLPRLISGELEIPDELLGE